MPFYPEEIGYTGISYPFRFSPSGSVAVSTVNFGTEDISHIVEAMMQIVHTRKGERFFNRDFGAQPVALVFRSNTPEEFLLVASEINDILTEYEPRVNLTEFVHVDSNPSEGWVRLRIGTSLKQTQVEQMIEVLLT